MKILITLDPVLAISPVIDDDISTSTVTREDVPYVNYAREWIKRLHDLGPHTKTRVYKAFAVNSSGDNVLICRFLTPQCPPRGFQSRRACLHLLSMMPFMRDSQSFIGEADLWCTTKEFWEIGAGDEEEHGVLLYNYLSYLQMTEAEEGAISVHDFMSITSTRNMRFRTSSNASLPSLAPSVGGKAKQLVVSGYPTDEAIEADVVFMVLGRAIPEGNTTYVLVRDVRQPFSTKHSPEGYLLINPCNGHTYSAVDPSCPLQEIYCLVTSYNLWANIQTESTIANTFFDVLNPRNWRPFFGQLMNPHKGGLRTVQEAVQYVDTTSAYAYQVEKIVLQGLRNGLRRWRSKRQRYVKYHEQYK